MTLKECKLITMQKLFSADTKIDSDDAAEDYLAAIPGAINEAITRIVAVRPLRKSVEFDVSQNDAEQGFDLQEVAYDFKNTGNIEVYYINENGVPIKVSGVKIIAGRYIVVPPANEDTTCILYYDAKPTRVTLDSLDEMKLPLDDDACALIPLYVAGELYKDDDMTISTYYMNEFENGLGALVAVDSGIMTDRFTSESGW